MASESLQSQGAPARRTVVAAAGAAGLAVALTACGSGESSSSGSSTSQNGGSGGGSGDDGAGGTVLAKASDIPEGGGKVFGDQGVVVTQPTKGEFKAFSSQCTHQGCAVSRIADGVIVCPCHNSEFSAADGSVRKGPAAQPLPAKNISVTNGEIRLV
ncbi:MULTISPECIES: Rieske (2Fe-2S) protein [Streptomyces]|uniref:Cytochrome bc1 complex Rieske iron-sulfur subunit n=1 Tax=Streptomyces thermogriseus TaxID=75292 RepID=A0ABN1T050_9ACTN|nr:MULTISPECIES: Rieske (2Fe-2S) protein [Streptomyces]MDN5384695.1 Rieske (2Fe-2S) protein [Streptomyces sp. LB8]